MITWSATESNNQCVAQRTRSSERKISFSENIFLVRSDCMGEGRLGLDEALASHCLVGPDRCATLRARCARCTRVYRPARWSWPTRRSWLARPSRRPRPGPPSSLSSGVQVVRPGVPVRQRSQDVSMGLILESHHHGAGPPSLPRLPCFPIPNTTAIAAAAAAAAAAA